MKWTNLRSNSSGSSLVQHVCLIFDHALDKIWIAEFASLTVAKTNCFIEQVGAEIQRRSLSNVWKALSC